MFYAQVNEENICIAVSRLSGEVAGANLIALSSFDSSLIGKKYENGAWTEQPQPTPALSETEQAVLDTAVDVEYLVCLKDMDL